MADSSEVSLAELQRRRGQSDTIRRVARGLKALVRKHFDRAVFQGLAEHETACNIESVSFAPSYACADGTVVPPHALVQFHIGTQEGVDPEQMENARQQLEKDLREVFGGACSDLKYEPTAGSMIFQNQCTGWATIYGLPDALGSSMSHAVDQGGFTELRYLLLQDLKAQTGRGG